MTKKRAEQEKIAQVLWPKNYNDGSPAILVP